MRALGYLGIGGAALGAGYYLLRQSQGEGSALDLVLDDLVTLTTSDEHRLSQLEPATQAQARALIQALYDQGLSVKVGQTLRTKAQEKEVIDAGNSAVKSVSWHQLGRALDLYPIDETGDADMAGRRLDLFQQMHAAARDLGFRGIAFEADGVTRHYITNSKGKRIWDGGHLEWRDPYGSIAQAVAAEGAYWGLA